MMFFAITNYAGMFGIIEYHMGVFEQVIARDPNSASSELPADAKQNIATFVAGFALQEARILGLDHTQQMAQQLVNELNAHHHYTPELMLKELKKLKQLIVMESAKRKFAFIPPPNDKYFEQERLFGDRVFEAFEGARQDVRDAGNCLAVALPTASVFHSMRIAEHGLRSLAKKLRVRLTHRGVGCPVEFGDWNAVITGIKNKITEARRLPAGPKRQARLEKYSQAADHCEYMKDIWRNNIAHTRNPYTDVEAVAVLERVRDFMQFLAPLVSKPANSV